MKNKIIRFIFFFLVFLLIFQLFSKNDNQKNNGGDDVVVTSASKFVIGKEVKMNIKNNSKQAIIISSKCPQNPLFVEFYNNGKWSRKENTIKDTTYCTKIAKEIKIQPNEKTDVRFGLWNKNIFDGLGKYRITYRAIIEGESKSYSHEINIVEPSFLRKGWNTLLYKPILNTLLFFVSKIPGHSLGWAIIFLTLVIKLILLVPNHKALKSQKQLQRVQPQLDALKQKYKNDPQKLAQETMAIWKKHKVSPLGSCLPMLIQFPILIALFYVVRDGISVIDPNLLYTSLKSFDTQKVNAVFLGIIDLTKINIIILPIIVGGLQFFQVRLSFAKNKSKALAKKGNTPDIMPMMNKMMQFMLPVMIAVFTATLPAAVGFYWGVSTLFAIGQQFVVNKST